MKKLKEWLKRDHPFWLVSEETTPELQEVLWFLFGLVSSVIVVFTIYKEFMK